ncbi:MAG: Rrf2 family transcriptional regulator [Myxococcales bacterium]|nr:Rrf2 family transcriptional regulator [Myxococcales bacterium]
MQLTLYTDYGLRVLLHLAVEDGAMLTIQEIADAFGISRNHLIKVVARLSALGYVETTRGKSGGVRLARSTSEINVGRVVRDLEPHFNFVECFDADRNTCPIAAECTLSTVMANAQRAFFAVLDGYVIRDLAHNKEQVRALLHPFGLGKASAS